MWIKNEKDGRLLQIHECIEIRPVIIDYDGCMAYRIDFTWIKAGTTINFDNEKEMNNFMDQIYCLYKFDTIDPKQESVKL